ncbi:MAG: hypothetical protein ABSF25_22855 [Bryobacteraceae bacterium]|jgi:hypothetical protein
MDPDLKDYLDQRFTAVDRRFTEKIYAANASMFQRLDEMAATLEEPHRLKSTISYPEATAP